MKKHIDDLRNVLYIHDLTVVLEEDIPAFPATWTLAHPYFTLLMIILCERYQRDTAAREFRLLSDGAARNITVFHQNQPPFVAA